MSQCVEQIAGLRLQLLEGQTDPDHLLWNRLIVREHPLAGAPIVGSQLRYLIRCDDGIIGALATGILVDPSLGGTGIPDYISKPGELTTGTYDMLTQVTAQAKAVGMTLLWSGVGSLILFKLVDIIVGLRPGTDQEREGLDITDHGERAYNY